MLFVNRHVPEATHIHFVEPGVAVETVVEAVIENETQITYILDLAQIDERQEDGAATHKHDACVSKIVRDSLQRGFLLAEPWFVDGTRVYIEDSLRLEGCFRDLL